MMRSIYYVLLFSVTAGFTWSAQVIGQDRPLKRGFAGPTDTGFLLPNGWHLTPVGQHIETSDMVLNIHPLSDGRHAIATCNGFNEHKLLLVDTLERKIVAEEKSLQSWFGLAVDSSASNVWWSGGGAGYVHQFQLRNQQWTRQSQPEPDSSKYSREELTALRDKLRTENAFRSGLLLDEKRGCLYSLHINAGKLVSTSLTDPKVTQEVTLGGRPYDVQFAADHRLLYVSDWANAQLYVVQADDLRVVSKIKVGIHPNQIVAHPTDNRMFVACASSNGVWVIDAVKGVVTETIYTSLFPGSPEGSTPDAVAISPDGETLFVANADNNCVAMIDIEEPSKSAVEGFIPTGWYPTSLAVSRDGKKMLVGVGKGLQSKPNPFFKESELDKKPEGNRSSGNTLPYPYIGTTMTGAISVVDIPEDDKLKEYTELVYKNCPYSDKNLTAAPHSEVTAIPQKVGDPSPIKYVIYVIKENRTYDQVFGDLASGPNPKGNGDPSLCMFPRKVTPNHHKLAEEFVLLDNVYCNGQVSRDGHPWSTMAYNTDYIARDWHLTYSRRLGVDDDDEGNLSNSPAGYIWDACLRAGLTYRSYKEYGGRVSDGSGAVKMEGRVPGLIGHMCPNFGIGGSGGRERDNDLVEVMLAEYRQFVKDNNMPRFIIMSLGEDHTDGTRVGSFTPQACVASNDQALGKLVEAVSHGPLWKETAIFVIEDDAQNGPDHVDAHRTVSLVISPYTKRGFVDSTQYSTVSLIRTMELILGLEPLSQYDAAARPMFNSFTAQADLRPYTREEAQIDLNAKNEATAYGADRSNQMDFSEYDRIDDFELNEILWHAVMGENAPLPPAVRRAIAFRAQR